MAGSVEIGVVDIGTVEIERYKTVNLNPLTISAIPISTANLNPQISTGCSKRNKKNFRLDQNQKLEIG